MVPELIWTLAGFAASCTVVSGGGITVVGAVAVFDVQASVNTEAVSSGRRSFIGASFGRQHTAEQLTAAVRFDTGPYR
jgi:hypothetical protein